MRAEPLLDGGPLVAVAICCQNRVPHHLLSDGAEEHSGKAVLTWMQYTCKDEAHMTGQDSSQEEEARPSSILLLELSATACDECAFEWREEIACFNGHLLNNILGL